MILLVASAPAHVRLVVPLRRLLRARFRSALIVYGGRPLSWWKPEGALWIGRFARPARTRAAMLEGAVQRVLGRYAPTAVIVTSARYHLEQAFLRLAWPCLLYHSTAFMEATRPDGQRDHGPRVHLYDQGAMVLTQGTYLRDQLVSHGVDPARIRVVGSPALEAL